MFFSYELDRCHINNIEKQNKFVFTSQVNGSEIVFALLSVPRYEEFDIYNVFDCIAKPTLWKCRQVLSMPNEKQNHNVLQQNVHSMNGFPSQRYVYVIAEQYGLI